MEPESLPTLGGGAAAAIANAISDALRPLGMHINELPASTARLFRLVRAAAGTGGQRSGFAAILFKKVDSVAAIVIDSLLRSPRER